MKKRNTVISKNILIHFFKASIFSTFLLSFFFLTKTFLTYADSVTTAITVGNNAPVITDGPRENPTSSSTTPTNVGSNTTWEATATDSFGDDYYLIICSTDSVTPVNNNPPTCGATTWCTSTATDSGDPASCNRTALAGDSVSNTWYAFVCDGTAAAACSTPGDDGSGDSGTPFDVNHAPSFTAVSNDAPKNPGQTLTWSTTSSDSTDSDTVKLIVCKTAGITGDACDGGAEDTWCSSSQVASNPTCGYSIPSVYPDGSYDAYVYVVDGHNFPATGVYQASNVSFSVNNIAPVVSAVTINGGSAIDLTESSTKAVTLTATVTDNNSCYGGEIDSVLAYAYRSSVAYSGCNTVGEADNNYCYPEITCTVVGGSCTDITDGSANYTCSANIYYYADPTDTLTEYPSDTWLDTIKATDDDTDTHALEVSTGVEINSLIGFELGYTVTASLNYGSLGIGEKNDPLDKVLTTTPTGNIGLDQEHSGAANMCVDFPTCSGGTPIPVGYQHYALAASTAYSSGTALTTSPFEIELNIPKPITGSPTTKDTWWGIEVPAGTDQGSYTGSNTITAVKSEILEW